MTTHNQRLYDAAVVSTQKVRTRWLEAMKRREMLEPEIQAMSHRIVTAAGLTVIPETIQERATYRRYLDYAADEAREFALYREWANAQQAVFESLPANDIEERYLEEGGNPAFLDIEADDEPYDFGDADVPSTDAYILAHEDDISGARLADATRLLGADAAARYMLDAEAQDANMHPLDWAEAGDCNV